MEQASTAVEQAETDNFLLQDLYHFHLIVDFPFHFF
jgi:hypothetical protein